MSNESDMRFSAPRISKAIAAVALISLASLITISLLADAGRVSAWMEERRVHLGEDNQSQTGTNFEIDENNVACSIIGTVEITLPGQDAPSTADYTLGNVANGLFTIGDADIPDYIDCGAGDPPAAGKNELRALLSFNHENENSPQRGASYQLTASTSGLIADSATVNVVIRDVNEAPMLGVDSVIPGRPPGTLFPRLSLPVTAPTPEYAANIAESADIGDSVGVWEWVDLPGDGVTGPVRYPDGTFQFHRNLGDRLAVMAFDEDAGDNAALTYSLRAANSSGAITTSAFRGPFRINRYTGAITVSGTLDYETTGEYVMYIVVTDDGAPALSDSAKLTINVADAPTPTATPTRAPAPTATSTRTAAPAATPTRTPGRVDQDVLRRVGALERLLATLQTLIQSLQSVIVAQDSRIAEQDERIAAQDSRIAAQDDKITAQDTRIAALEAQLATATPTPTPTPTATPTPTPLPTAAPSPTPTATPEPTPASSACVQAMQPGSVSGSWNSACLTANPTHGNTYYARFYTFTLDAAADVTITLASDKPPYLYLLSGAGTSGDVLQETGDGGQTSATITDTLRAGSYTIEATTWNTKTLGDFTLTLAVRE